MGTNLIRECLTRGVKWWKFLSEKYNFKWEAQKQGTAYKTAYIQIIGGQEKNYKWRIKTYKSQSWVTGVCMTIGAPSHQLKARYKTLVLQNTTDYIYGGLIIQEVD